MQQIRVNPAPPPLEQIVKLSIIALVGLLEQKTYVQVDHLISMKRRN